MGCNYREAARVTPREFHFYQKAHKIKQQTIEFNSARQAWFHLAVKATKGKGKNTKSAYKNFEDFYDNQEHFFGIFGGSKKEVRRKTLADMNSLLNDKKGG